ncbi:ABC transporter permease [Actinoplanes sp. NPDC024001]|uniref:ABC transporter permease n=1 Tax=Actinoplanes sp. NPDC024001 TaxID=3154598 RepID=UPI00340B4ECD
MLSRDRIGQFVAVLLGTVLVTTFLLLLTSGRPRVPDRFEGFAAVVAAPAAENRPDEFAEPVPWSAEAVRTLTARIRAVPGVSGVAVDREFYAQPVRDGRPVAGSIRGYAWHGTNPPGPGEVVTARELGFPAGASITVLTGAGPVQWRVTGHTDLPGLHVSERVAAGLAPGVRALGISGDPEPAALAAAVGTAGTVLTGDERGRAEPRADARVRWIGMQVLSATAAVAGFACVFLVASASAHQVNQRRREIGMLRAIGATPRQVRSMLHRSALLLGVQAAVAGVLLGSLSALLLAPRLVRAGLEPAGYAVRWQPWVLAAAFAAGPLVALAGTAVAARRVSRIGALEALRVAEMEQTAMSRARWAAGLLAAALAVAAGVAAAASTDLSDLGTYALFGAMALIAAAALLAPAVVPALVRIFLAPFSGIIATLARESARTAVRRTAATAAPVLFTVAFAVFVTGTVQTSAAAYDARRSAAVPAETVLVPDGTPGLHDAVAGRAPLDTTVYVAGSAVMAIGADEVPAGTALASEQAAARYGPAVTVTFADGTTSSLRVTGIAPPGPFAADLVLSRDTVRGHDPSALAPAAYPAPPAPAGTSPAPSSPVGAHLTPSSPAGAYLTPPGPAGAYPAQPGPAGLGARHATPADMARQADADDDRLIATFTMLLLAVSAGAGGLAVANTLLMTTRYRRPDYRVLRRAGATRRQVLQAVSLETTLAVAIGSLLGGGAGLLAIAGSARSLAAQVGQAVPVLISWPVAAATVLACLALALGAALPPAAK